MVAFKDPSGEVVVEVNGLWDIEHGWGQEVFAPVGGFFEHDGVVYEFSANASLVGWHDWELEWDGGEVYFSDEVADESYDNVFNVPLSLIESAEVFVPPSLEAETFGAEGFWQRLFRRKRRFPNYRADDLMEISLQGKDEEVLRELFITTAKKKGLEEEIVERFSYGYWGGPIPDGVDIPLEQIVGTNEYNGLAWDTMVYEMLEMQENGSALKAWDELGWDSKADMEKAIKGAETFEAVHDDYLISMQRNNPLSRHYIPPKKKSAETFGAEEIYGVCPYCGFDAEAAVAYQSKQNDETLTPDQIHDEVEFYLYESPPRLLRRDAKLNQRSRLYY